MEPPLHIFIPPAQMLKKSRDLLQCMVASGAEILAGAKRPLRKYARAYFEKLVAFF